MVPHHFDAKWGHKQIWKLYYLQYCFFGYASVRPFLYLDHFHIFDLFCTSTRVLRTLYFDSLTLTCCQIWTSYWTRSIGRIYSNTGRSKVGGSKYRKGRWYENGRSTEKVELMCTHFFDHYRNLRTAELRKDPRDIDLGIIRIFYLTILQWLTEGGPSSVFVDAIVRIEMLPMARNSVAYFGSPRRGLFFDNF